MTKARNIAVLIAVVAVLCAGMLLCACKPSDAIVERIYDQKSKNIDYDNPEKYYIPDSSSKITIDDLHMDVDEELEKEQIERDLPSKVDKTNAQEVKTSKYSKTGKSKTRAKKIKSGKSKQKSDTAKGKEIKKGSKNKSPAGQSGHKEDGGEQQGKSFDAETGSYGYNPDDDTYQNRSYDNRYGKTEDLPDDAKTIAAIGENATMVLVLGKKGTLIGSSQEYLKRDAVQDVFASKDIEKTAQLWANGGKKTTGKDVDRIIEASPDALVVYPGQLTGKQERTIAQNCPDIAIVTTPAPTSMENIFKCMDIISTLLKKSSDGASLQRAKNYKRFADDTLNAAKNTHGGGVVTYGGYDYSIPDEKTKAKSGDLSTADPIWSLYISGWDEDAKAVATYNGSELFADTGAAYTNTGWAWGPMSHMMSVAGVINNAAAYGLYSSNRIRPVLCFNENQLKYRWEDFSVETDESRGGGTFTKRGYYVLTNACDKASSANPYETHPLGTNDFDTVIVKTKRIKDALDAARHEDDGLYTMYGWVNGSDYDIKGSGIGRVVKNSGGKKSILWSTANGDNPYKILVSPCGYVGSWTDGSLETPLEALWVASEFRSYDKDELAAQVQGFYKDFYGYNISDSKLKKVLSGLYAQDE